MTPLELIDEQIAQANDGRPEQFTLWREKTDVVLRNVLGDAHPIYERFTNVSYAPGVWTSNTPKASFDRFREAGVRAVIALLEAARFEIEVAGAAAGVPESPTGSTDRRTIFLIHGRNEARKHEVARFLSRLTANEPVVLHEQPNAGRTIIEKFEDHAADAAYAVAIMTGDDVGRALDEDEEAPRPRQNVTFELGFFFGALGRAHVAVLYEEGVERPSDTDGIVRIELDDAGGWKGLLARELHEADIGVRWDVLGSA